MHFELGTALAQLAAIVIFFGIIFFVVFIIIRPILIITRSVQSIDERLARIEMNLEQNRSKTD